ncbi:MAG: hypothetical protein V1656_02240 [Candidatus Jorgensenbacteria bacterium]
MSRSSKQFVYGAFYLALLALILWGGFRAFVPGPSCGDGILNQNEERVDCGGPCAPCAVQPETLRASEAQAFSTEGGRTVFLVQIINPNAAYAAASFSYSFVMTDSSGRALGSTPRKTDRIHASERRYLFESEVPVSFTSTGQVSLMLSDVEWKQAAELPRVEFSALRIATDVNADGIRVQGEVENRSPFGAREVKIIALLFDRAGAPLFAAQTVVDEIAGGATQAFPPIKFPADGALARAADPAATEVFVSGL